MHKKYIGVGNTRTGCRFRSVRMYLLIVCVVTLSEVTGQSCVFAADDAQTYYKQAQQSLLRGKTGAAERNCLRAIHMDGSQPEMYYFLADLYLGQRRFNEALQVVEKGLEQQPGSADLWARRGLIQHRAGDLQSARLAYEQAVMLAPQNPAILDGAAGFYQNSGNLVKAEEYSLRSKQVRQHLQDQKNDSP